VSEKEGVSDEKPEAGFGSLLFGYQKLNSANSKARTPKGY